MQACHEVSFLTGLVPVTVDPRKDGDDDDDDDGTNSPKQMHTPNYTLQPKQKHEPHQITSGREDHATEGGEGVPTFGGRGGI